MGEKDGGGPMGEEDGMSYVHKGRFRWGVDTRIGSIVETNHLEIRKGVNVLSPQGASNFGTSKGVAAHPHHGKVRRIPRGANGSQRCSECVSCADDIEEGILFSQPVEQSKHL